MGLFQTERFDDGTLSNMLWSFPIANGDYQVRLYFAELYYTSDGQRIFDVRIEGTLVVDDLDLHALLGHDAGYVTFHDVTVSDGVLNIEFVRGAADNSKINAIEIIRASAGGDTLSGVLFSAVPSFPQGSVTPGNITATGTLFSKPPTFFSGAATSAITSSGVLFSRPPSFFPGPSYVRLDGTTDWVFTPNSAPLQITGDIDLIWCGEPDNYTPASSQVFIGKANVSGPTQGYRWALLASGAMQLSWVETGPIRKDANSLTLPVGTKWIRATLDVDNGASGHDVKFYTSADPINTPVGSVAWSQLGSTVTGGATTNILTGTFDLNIGRNHGAEHFAGKVYTAVVRNGIGGSAVANPDFRTNTQGNWSTPPQTDDHTNSWSFMGDAVWVARGSVQPGNVTLSGSPFTRPPTFITGSLAASVYIYTTGEVDTFNVVNETDASSPLWPSIDDDPNTPNDSDWINNIGAGSALFDLTDMLPNFGTATGATLTARVRGVNYAGTPMTLTAIIHASDGIEPYTDTVTVATVSANTSFANTLPITFTLNAAGLAATKPAWDAAKLKLQWENA